MVNDRTLIVLVALGVFCITFVSFSPALNNDFVGWDDEIYVTRNPRVQVLTPPGIAAYFSAPFFSSYTPLTLLSHALDVRLWGFSPRGHHLTSIVLHSFNAAWVFFLIIALAGKGSERRISGGSLLIGAAAGALLYALHPLRVEAAVCISARKDVLCEFFLLPSVLAYIGSIRGETGTNHRRWYPLSVFLFLCAMLAKATPLLMPLILIALDIIAFRRPWRGKESVSVFVEKIPFVLVSLILGGVAIAVAPVGEPNPYLMALSTGENFLVPLYNLSFYLWKTLWPFGLAIIYEYPRGWVLVAGTVVTLTAAMAALIALRRRKPFAVAALLWYALFLLPVAGFLPSATQPLADRFSYLPGVGVFTVVGLVLSVLWASSGQNARRAYAAVLALMVAVECSLSVMQTATWRDRLSVWSNTLRVSSGLASTHYNYGLALQMNGDFDGAVVAYGRALTLKPDYADAAVNCGNILRVRGNGPGARRWYERALGINPRHELALYNLALMDLAADSVDGAGEKADLLLRSDSLSVNGLLIRGQILLRGGRHEEALALFTKALSVDPSNGGVWYLAATLSMQSGRMEEGKRAMVHAARLGIAEAREYLTMHGVEW